MSRKRCPSCKNLISTAYKTCPYCGYVFIPVYGKIPGFGSDGMLNKSKSRRMEVKE